MRFALLVLVFTSFIGALSQAEEATDIDEAKAELLIAKSEKLALQQIKGLIKKYRGKKLEPSLQMRLAELHMRRAKAARFFEMNRDNNELRSLLPKTIQSASSQREIQKAIDVYSLIERRFPNFIRLDTVLFNKAFALQQSKKPHLADKIYWQLIRQFPDSQFIPDSHLAIGEIAFSKQKFAHALEHFTAIEKYPESRVYPYGLYKAGWTYYNLSKSKQALLKMEQVVAFGHRVASDGLESRLDLRKEALKDMTLFYGEVYAARSAVEYFTKQAKSLDLSEVILKLAALYNNHSRFDEERIVLNSYIGARGDEFGAIEAHERIAESFELQKNRELAAVSIGRFQKYCQKLSGQEDMGLFVEECKDKLKSTSLGLASKWLRLWRKNPEYVKFAAAAESAYVVYLEEEKDLVKSSISRLAYADLVFKLEKYKIASENYALAAKGLQDKKLRHQADYSAVVSFQKFAGQEFTSDQESKYRDLIAVYMKNNPQGPFRLDLGFSLGMIDYKNKRFDEASETFKSIGESFSNTEKGQKATDLYLDILNQQKKYEELFSYSTGLLKSKLSPQRRQLIARIAQETRYLILEKLAESNASAAALEFKKFSDSYPDSKLSEEAWWTAANLHEKSREFTLAAQTYEQLPVKFASSKRKQESLIKSAEIFERTAQLSSAARVLEKLYAFDKKEKWIKLAAEYYVLEQMHDQARKLLLILQDSSQEDIRRQAFVSLLKTSEKAKVLKKGLTSDDNYIRAFSELEEIRMDSKMDDPEIFKRTKRILAYGKTASKEVLAEARLMQARILAREMKRQSLKTSIDRLTIVLSLKTEKLDKAQRAYQAVANYGAAIFSRQANLELASLYKDYVKDLREMPLPRGLASNEEIPFRQEMDRLIIPIDDKAAELKEITLNAGHVTKSDAQLEIQQQRVLPTLAEVGS